MSAAGFNDAALVLLLGLVFGIIILLVASRKNFAGAIILGSLTLALAFPEQVPDIFVETLTDVSVLELVAIVLMIKLLATILLDSGQLRELIRLLHGKLPYRGMLIATPSILGLLPVPGGALMSAPIIGEQGEQVGMRTDEMMFINLWYRHIWFLIFPLAPPLVLIADLADMNIYTVIAWQTPLFAIAFAVGLLYLRKFHQPTTVSDWEAGVGSARALAPIGVTVGAALGLSAVLPTYAAYVVALPMGIALSFAQARNRGVDMLRKGISLELGLAIFGIMFFKNIIFASGVAGVISSYFSDLPVVATIAAFSFIIGFLTAHNLAAISILYPLFASFLGDAGTVALLYVSSFMGYLISPIHPCVVLSYEYFCPKLTNVYKLLAPPAVAMVVAAVAIYGVL
jgi:hypothetical protein